MIERIDQATRELATASLLSQEKYAAPGSLARHRFKVFSQFGQDGMIAEIFRRIGPGRRRFAEIGTAPLENNTGYLLLQGWEGLWVDAALPADEDLPAPLRELHGSGRLRLEREFINRENIVALLARHAFDRDLDFLGIDIDYNTYHILDVCLALAPRVISVEYNGQLPPDLDWVAPYDPGAVWGRTIAYGAGLKAIENRARRAGYALVGCELSGTDAFFVREDLLGDRFDAPFTSEHHWEPLRMTLDAKPGHAIVFPPPTHPG